jgi:hypothetical protein
MPGAKVSPVRMFEQRAVAQVGVTALRSALASFTGRLGVRWRLTAGFDQEAGEREPVSVGVERLRTVLGQMSDPVEVVEQRELPGRVVPPARVIVLDPGSERRERLHLHLVRPPARSKRQPVRLLNCARVALQLLEPLLPLVAIRLSPAERPVLSIGAIWCFIAKAA